MAVRRSPRVSEAAFLPRSHGPPYTGTILLSVYIVLDFIPDIVCLQTQPPYGDAGEIVFFHHFQLGFYRPGILPPDLIEFGA